MRLITRADIFSVVGNVASSTFRKRINAGEDPNTVAAEEFPKFNKAGGKPLAGLTRRRAAEVELFQTSSDVSALPCGTVDVV
jgi:GH24 family phage-related lysozyme (muramidase)